MKNILVSGYIGFNNFGDEAIFCALSTYLKENNYRVSVLCGNKTEVEKLYNVQTYYFKNLFEILRAIFKCDVLISGGGSLLQNKTSNFSLFYYLFVILLAKICFKKVIIFAQGIEPIIGKLPENITKNVLKLVDFISVRDNNSKKLLKSWDIESILVSDPAYSLVQDKKISDKKDGLIVQLRSFKGIKKEFLADLAFAISKYYKGKISVFSFQDEIDEKKCLELVEELKKQDVVAEYISNKSIEDTIEILNNVKFVISTRLHGLIISSALQSKTFALSYDQKVKTLANEIDIENIDIYNYSQKELDEKLCKFFKDENKKYLYRHFDWEFLKKAVD